MAYHVRTNNCIKCEDPKSTQIFGSINKAKKASRKLQTEGHIVSNSKHRTAKLHHRVGNGK